MVGCIWIHDGPKTLIHSKKYAMTHAVEIILTLSATFKGRAPQSDDAQTDISLSLDMTTYFLKYPLLSLKDRRR